MFLPSKHKPPSIPNQPVDDSLGLPCVAAAKEEGVVEDVVEIVAFSAAGVTILAGANGKVGVVEIPVESTEKLGHGEIRFGVPIVAGGIIDERVARACEARVSAPQVAVQERWLHRQSPDNGVHIVHQTVPVAKTDAVSGKTIGHRLEAMVAEEVHTHVSGSMDSPGAWNPMKLVSAHPKVTPMTPCRRARPSPKGGHSTGRDGAYFNIFEDQIGTVFIRKSAHDLGDAESLRRRQNFKRTRLRFKERELAHGVFLYEVSPVRRFDAQGVVDAPAGDRPHTRNRRREPQMPGQEIPPAPGFRGTGSPALLQPLTNISQKLWHTVFQHIHHLRKSVRSAVVGIRYLRHRDIAGKTPRKAAAARQWRLLLRRDSEGFPGFPSSIARMRSKS